MVKVKWGWIISACIHTFINLRGREKSLSSGLGRYREQQGSSKPCDDCIATGDFKKGDSVLKYFTLKNFSFLFSKMSVKSSKFTSVWHEIIEKAKLHIVSKIVFMKTVYIYWSRSLWFEAVKEVFASLQNAEMFGYLWAMVIRIMGEVFNIFFFWDFETVKLLK